MPKYRDTLPQLGAELFLTDGGIETTLVFHEGVDLPYFAAFHLLGSPDGHAVLRRYFARYAELARAQQSGLILETPTWRANPDWAARLGYDAPALDAANRRAVDLLLDIRREYEAPDTPVVISGNLGPRGDGYRADARMSAVEAERYHAPQVRLFAASEVDLVAAFTMNYADEAIGIARAARAAEVPAVIAFTTETDGRLPSGEPLGEAIERTDAETAGSVLYYMINCVHPTHLEPALAGCPGDWCERIRGLRANASRRSHAELDESADLDEGDPEELARGYQALRGALPFLSIVGGCCGTDHRHVAAVGRAMRTALAAESF